MFAFFPLQVGIVPPPAADRHSEAYSAHPAYSFLHEKQTPPKASACAASTCNNRRTVSRPAAWIHGETKTMFRKTWVSHEIKSIHTRQFRKTCHPLWGRQAVITWDVSQLRHGESPKIHKLISELSPCCRSMSATLNCYDHRTASGPAAWIRDEAKTILRKPWVPHEALSSIQAIPYNPPPLWGRWVIIWNKLSLRNPGKRPFGTFTRAIDWYNQCSMSVLTSISGKLLSISFYLFLFFL